MEKVAEKLQKYKKYNFFCEKCLYGCNNKNNFNKHLSTSKHLNTYNTASVLTKKLHGKNFICSCGKKYKHRQSLYTHQKTCNFAPSVSPKVSKSLQKVSNEYFCNCGKKYRSKSGFYKHKSRCIQLHNEEVLNNLVSNATPTNDVGNNEVAGILKSILEENKELRREIKNLKLGNTITNNNQHYTINMFLNEKCKNAMNLEDFVDKIKFTLEDLQYTKENGYAKGISNVFIKSLNDMDITERPIHCSDQKRLQFYIKNDDEWSKDSNNEKIDNTIEKVSKKQLKSIQDWVEANPDYLESDAKTEEYFTLVRSITQPNDDKNLRNIKRKVGENVKIDK
jgi:hypothetical protein